MQTQLPAYCFNAGYDSGVISAKAEKPTGDLPEINWVAIAESNAIALKQAQTHADMLAEALRGIVGSIDSGRPSSMINTVCATQALAAYESEVRQ
jgi:hypothetical protein